MPTKRIILELPAQMADELARIADALAIADLDQAAMLGLAEWIARRKADLDDRDPDQRYFINEALDQLATRKKD